MRQLFGATKIDFIGKRYIAFTLSALLILSGFTGIVQIVRGHARLGIDFSGGFLITLKFEQPVTVDQFRQILTGGGFAEANIQNVPSENKFLIKMKKSDQEIGQVSGNLQNIIRQALPSNNFVVEKSESIGPVVGKSLQKSAFLALFWAMIGIMIYIWWRFDFQFGVAAAIATIHDVIALIGVFYILGKEYNLLFVTSLLTVAGYSLNDTVVVFDRIRENLRLHIKLSIGDVINKSINEVLCRTLITSLTTLMAVGLLLFFGGSVIHDFAMALCIGIVVGTYSSDFVASPIIFEWQRINKKRM